MGKRERERIRNLPSTSPLLDPSKLRSYTDEIARERGVILLPERGGKFRDQVF
jgi:hypothetical protein